jgi:hypothetical protein
MAKRTLILSLALSLGAGAFCSAQQIISHQTRTVANITATLDAMQLPANAQIVTNFASPATANYALPCLSAYRDFRYELVDGAGRIVPVDPQILAHPPQELDIQDHWPRIPCERQWAHQGQTLVRLRTLYPNLSNGVYTLRITFTPRGVGGQEATFSPIRITITN